MNSSLSPSYHGIAAWQFNTSQNNKLSYITQKLTKGARRLCVLRQPLVLTVLDMCAPTVLSVLNVLKGIVKGARIANVP